jgi:hypothetical protein
MGIRYSSTHAIRNLSPCISKGQHRLSGMLHGHGRKIVGWKIAADCPPANVTRRSQAFDSPDRNVRCEMPSWPETNLAVFQTLPCEVFLNFLATFATPMFLNSRVVPIRGIHAVNYRSECGLSPWLCNPTYSLLQILERLYQAVHPLVQFYAGRWGDSAMFHARVRTKYSVRREHRTDSSPVA